MINPDVFLDFIDFVAARDQAYQSRYLGLPYPWTQDPIVNAYKFTNVFRVLDYGSQFLLRELVDPALSPRDQLMRCFLYRHTGRWEAWEIFNLIQGRMPTVGDLLDGTVLEMFKAYREAGDPVFTSAYLVYPQSNTGGTDKLESIVSLASRLFEPDTKSDIMPRFLGHQDDPKAQFLWLRAQQGVGDFMASQVLTDWGYTPQCGRDIEEDFDACGPGAVKGALLLDPSGKIPNVLRWARDAVHGMDSPPLLGGVRLPSLRDTQNLLCEFSKYHRYSTKPITKTYTPTHPGPQPEPLIPEHWRAT